MIKPLFFTLSGQDNDRNMLKKSETYNMNFNIIGDLKDIKSGLQKAAELLGWEISEKGTPVLVRQSTDNRLCLKKVNKGCAINGKTLILYRN